MGTYDEILGTGNNPPKGSQEWHEQQQNGSSASLSAKDTGQETVTAPAPAATGSKPDTVETPPAQQDASSGSLSYAELFKQLNPYKPPTEEELAKERKKQKREQIFAAIGDGISALSNLFFTTQYAPNMYTGKDTASGKVKVKYDRLMKERNANARAYASGLIGAMQADDAKADGERKWLRQLGIDKKNDDRYNEGIQHRNERERVADQRYSDEFARKKERDKVDDDKWQKSFDENKRKADRTHNLAVQTQKDNKDLREKQIKATGARSARGKQLGFSDGDGNQVSIYENVWKGSMQQVYDVMLSDLAPQDEKERRSFERQMKKLDTQQKKEDYVKQNWHKSSKAAAIMMSLSKLDPATMTSGIDEGLGWGRNSGNNNETDW